MKQTSTRMWAYTYTHGERDKKVHSVQRWAAETECSTAAARRHTGGAARRWQDHRSRRRKAKCLWGLGPSEEAQSTVLNVCFSAEKNSDIIKWTTAKQKAKILEKCKETGKADEGPLKLCVLVWVCVCVCAQTAKVCVMCSDSHVSVGFRAPGYSCHHTPGCNKNKERTSFF